MSAWAVLASIGIYPIVGSNRYVLTPPVFSHVEIDNGLRTIKIEHEKGSQRLLWLNNVKSDISVVEHPDLQNLHWLSPLAP
jgi:putative alpha-1,2-mannosidase